MSERQAFLDVVLRYDRAGQAIWRQLLHRSRPRERRESSLEPLMSERRAMNQAVPDSATPSDSPADTRRKLSEIFSRDEIRMLNERSNLRGFAAVAFTWSVIVATLALLVWACRQTLGG